jgi:hypothetical protein
MYLSQGLIVMGVLSINVEYANIGNRGLKKLVEFTGIRNLNESFDLIRTVWVLRFFIVLCKLRRTSKLIFENLIFMKVRNFLSFFLRIKNCLIYISYLPFCFCYNTDTMPSNIKYSKKINECCREKYAAQSLIGNIYLAHQIMHKTKTWHIFPQMYSNFMPN